MTPLDLKKNYILKRVEEYYKLNKEEKIKDDKVHYSGRVYDQDELCNLIDSSLEFWLTYGRYSREFEKRFSEFLNIKHTTLVNSGSSANLIAISALTSKDLKNKRLKRGDSIIVSGLNFPTTISPIIQNGLIPIFIDIDKKTLNIKYNLIEQSIQENTKAIFVANTLGNAVNLKEIKKICKKYNLYLLLDNCDSLGTTYDNKHLDEYADISTHSFFPAHTITCGYAGAVCTNDKKLNDIILSFTEWGRKYHCVNCNGNCRSRYSRKEEKLSEFYDCRYIFSSLGYNLRPTDLQASILCAQLNKLPDFIQKRKDNYNFLRKKLKKFSDYFMFQDMEENSNVSWFGFCIILRKNLKFKRNNLIQYLEKNNIETRLPFAGNIITQPCFSDLKENEDYISLNSLKNSNYIMQNSFFIGVYPGLTKEDLDYIVNKIREFIKKF